MIDLSFFIIPERTEFSDELYAVIGRALCVATHYEANLRTLMVMLAVKSQRNNLVETDKLEETINKLWKKTLCNNIDRLTSLVRKSFQNKEFDTNTKEARAWLANFLSEKLHKAREARNYIAHNMTIGMEDSAEDEKYRQDSLKIIDEQVRYIAEADFHVAGLIEYFNTNNIAPSFSLAEYIERVTKWVCKVEY